MPEVRCARSRSDNVHMTNRRSSHFRRELLCSGDQQLNVHTHATAQEEMDVVIDLINRVEEQEALVVQNVRRPKTRLEAVVDDATLRVQTKVQQLQVRCHSRELTGA